MAYTATHMHARLSARKVRPLADLIRGNAEDLRAPNLGGLRVIDARVDGGPMFKRVRPRARGMAHIIKKRFSHIKVSIE
jgi:large subunit ribosomal protein L22